MFQYSPPPASAGTTYTAGHGVTLNGSEFDFAPITTPIFFLPFRDPVAAVTAAGAVVAAANTVYCARFVLPFRATFTKLAFRQGAVAAAGSAACGIYSADGNTQIVLSSVFDTNAAAGAVKSTTINVTIDPGSYIWAWCCSNTTATLVSVGGNTDTLVNTSLVQFGTAANASASGVLPATLGALTGFTPTNLLFGKLE